jgi:uncharacterized protein
MLFIYWLENNSVFAKRVATIQTRMQQRHDQLITSAFTVGEVLAGVYRQNVPHKADEIRGLLLSVVSEAVPFTVDAADRYARIRGTIGLTPADAIHLACAATAGTDLFLTNDKALVGKIIPGIQFIAGLETNII